MRFWFGQLLFFLWVLPVAAQSKHVYKTFYKEGNDQLEQRRYQSAVEKYREAFRLEQKAQRYKEEGAFFQNYLPRYKIALCYEHLDLVEAAQWVRKSKEALESEVIKRQKKLTAAYHRDLERILKSEADHRKQMKTQYDLALSKADVLLNQNKFKQAETAFEALYKLDPSRTEAAVKLQSIATIRRNYLKGKTLEVKTAVFDKNFTLAKSLLEQMSETDAAFADIPKLRAEIAEAEDRARLAKATPPKENHEKEQITPPLTSRPEEKKAVVFSTNPVKPTPVENRGDNNAKLRTEKRRAQLREDLLESLKPYRRGQPAEALARLEAIEPALGQAFGSYHWLKGVYLLGSYFYDPEPDPKLLQQAEQAIVEALLLEPTFSPQENLYPPYVLRFFAEATGKKGP